MRPLYSYSNIEVIVDRSKSFDKTTVLETIQFMH